MAVASVSVIVPTYREAPNIEPLVRRTFAALDDERFKAEMIIIDDDSQDGSIEIVERLAEEFPVRIIVRTGRRGLASAVLHGFEHATHDIFVVMDADLQHLPESIPALVSAIIDGNADIAVGSRFVAGAIIDAEWPWFRRLNGFVARALARPLVSLRDPMSGFCALRRETVNRAESLNPLGYKIVLELAVKARCKRCVEIPIRFAARHAGASKLSLGEQLRYLRHLARLYGFAYKQFAPLVVVVVIAAIGCVLWVN
ncbi:MAG: polyprenol monophosphomannose synthase [Phycisphaerae bacterium]